MARLALWWEREERLGWVLVPLRKWKAGFRPSSVLTKLVPPLSARSPGAGKVPPALRREREEWVGWVLVPPRKWKAGLRPSSALTKLVPPPSAHPPGAGKVLPALWWEREERLGWVLVPLRKWKAGFRPSTTLTELVPPPPAYPPGAGKVPPESVRSLWEPPGWLPAPLPLPGRWSQGLKDWKPPPLLGAGLATPAGVPTALWAPSRAARRGGWEAMVVLLRPVGRHRPSPWELPSPHAPPEWGPGEVASPRLPMEGPGSPARTPRTASRARDGAVLGPSGKVSLRVLARGPKGWVRSWVPRPERAERELCPPSVGKWTVSEGEALRLRTWSGAPSPRPSLPEGS